MTVMQLTYDVDTDDPRMRCQAYMSAGPPWYAAQCRLMREHEGEHDCGTVEEAKTAWEKAIREMERST